MGEKGHIVLRRAVERQRNLTAVAVKRARERLRPGTDGRPVVVEDNIRSQAESPVKAIADLLQFGSRGNLIGRRDRTLAGGECTDADFAYLRCSGTERRGQFHLTAEEIGGRGQRDASLAGSWV